MQEFWTLNFFISTPFKVQFSVAFMEKVPNLTLPQRWITYNRKNLSGGRLELFKLFNSRAAVSFKSFKISTWTLFFRLRGMNETCVKFRLSSLNADVSTIKKKIYEVANVLQVSPLSVW